MLGYVVRVDLKTNSRYVSIFESNASNEIFFSFHHLEKVDSKYGLG